MFPVLFLYPEFGETDFVEEWRELETLEQHIQVSTVKFSYIRDVGTAIYRSVLNSFRTLCTLFIY